MGSNRSHYVGTVLLGSQLRLVVEDCFKCGVLFAITEDLRNRCMKDHTKSFYCPNGHGMVFSGPTEEQKLRKRLASAEAREVAARDQRDAAVHETEMVRTALLRDRQRFANGVCPCCNRSFENVRRHMTTKHPDYDVTRVTVSAVGFRCSCGKDFRSLHGLHIHQSRMRPDDWASRALKQNHWDKKMAHTTAV